MFPLCCVSVTRTHLMCFSEEGKSHALCFQHTTQNGHSEDLKSISMLFSIFTNLGFKVTGPTTSAVRVCVCGRRAGWREEGQRNKLKVA